RYMGEAAGPAAEALLAALASENGDVIKNAAWALALSAPPGTPTAPVRAPLQSTHADTVEYAITILVRLRAFDAWPVIPPLITFTGGVVAAAAVWAARLLLSAEQARALWRVWLHLPREGVRWAARYELWRAGEAEPLPSSELIAASAVL